MTGLPETGQTLSLDLLTDMLRIRRMEEKCAELYGAGKIRGFLHLYIGEEACAAGALRAIMAEMYGKAAGCCRGHGGSMHLFDAARRFYGGNAIVGGGLPLAVGLALADKLQGIERVTTCFFDEGAMAEGAFHEAMNLAALWQLPVLFCCENNLYAMGTALARSESQTDLCAKAASYKVSNVKVDGMDVRAVHEATRQALLQVRAGIGPLSNMPPTAFAPIRCSTPTCTATRRKSSNGSSAARFTASPRSSRRRAS